MDRARSMLSTASLEQKFWAEAVSIACHLVNHSPTVSLQYKTPEEVWSKKPADYSYLRTFGCDAYVWVPKEQITILDARSKNYIFLSYADGTKRYRL